MGIRDNPPDSIDKLQNCNISTECPHCGDTVALIPVHKPVNTHDHSYFVALCPNHKRRYCKPIFAVYQPLNDFIQERYPIPSFNASSLHNAIPAGIREDYAEGARCMYVESYKAAVAMCRRVTEALACDKLGAKAKDTKGNTRKLFELIDLLHGEGLITKDIKDSAHELRHFGNYGAHVQDDGLDKVDLEEAKNVREITWQLLYAIYVAPFKTDELRKARAAKGKP
jgi:Domain of unknown function (DUF4145)